MPSSSVIKLVSTGPSKSFVYNLSQQSIWGLSLLAVFMV